MASTQCLVSNCYGNLNPRKKHSAKAFSNIAFNVMKSTKICAKSRRQGRKIYLKAKSGSAIELNQETNKGDDNKERRVRILIAGGGVGGLVLALAAKRKGFEVMVFEKDLSAVRGEGRHRGPIQLLSSALGVLVDIDKGVAKQVLDAGCVTGTRINGIADGLSGNWIGKFDFLAPAIKSGLPVTLVISRMVLQEILLNAVGDHNVFNNSKVVDFSQDPHKVVVKLEDGRKFEGDILIGADGISSEVRKKLFGAHEASYSGYTCYSGLANYAPSYLNSIGYRVFLGVNQYFVACDVGNGKIQWYAFHKEPPRCSATSQDATHQKLRLMEMFGCWCKDVTTLISKTKEEMILRRDIYDRDMIFSWGIGRVTLLGDAAHPMQPNLGLGGCLAIEDCHQLILELEKITKCGSNAFKSDEIASVLKRYEEKRLFRTMIVLQVTRIASTSLSFYQPFTRLGMLWLPPISFQVNELIFNSALPHFMNWMLTRNWL